jgi:predicted nucleic acid-binding protein
MTKHHGHPQWVGGTGGAGRWCRLGTDAGIYGIQRLADGRRKQLLRSTAEEVFLEFEERVLAFDAEAALVYATVVSGRDRAGLPIDGFDAQLASTCRVHEAALGTRSAKDFQDTEIEVIDPWRPGPPASTDSES